MSPATYAAYLADAVATYEAAPSRTTWGRIHQLATSFHARYPDAVLLLPIPPPPVRRGRPILHSLTSSS